MTVRQQAAADAMPAMRNVQAAARRGVYWSCGPHDLADVHAPATGKDVPRTPALRMLSGPSALLEPDHEIALATNNTSNTGEPKDPMPLHVPDEPGWNQQARLASPPRSRGQLMAQRSPAHRERATDALSRACGCGMAGAPAEETCARPMAPGGRRGQGSGSGGARSDHARVSTIFLPPARPVTTRANAAGPSLSGRGSGASLNAPAAACSASWASCAALGSR